MKKLDLALIFQISVTTDNMEQTLSNWRRDFKLNEDSIIRKSTKEIYDRGEYHCKNYKEQEVEFYHKYFRFDLAGIDMEMIEPITKDNSNPYTDFLSHGKNGLQHVGVKIMNRDDLVENMKEMGVPVFTYAYMGPKTDIMSERSDCYFYDLTEQLGIIIEAGGAVVGPLATDPRAGSQAALARLNSYAARPVLPEVVPDDRIAKMELEDIFQIAVVVKDADAVLENWKNMINFDHATITEGAEAGVCKFYRMEAGGIDYKIIQPTGEGIYADYLTQNGGNGIMYVASTLTDRDVLIDNMEKIGKTPIAHITEETGDPSDKDAYIYDYRDTYGMIIKVASVKAGPHK